MFAGVLLLRRFAWLQVVLAVLIIISGIRLLRSPPSEAAERSPDGSAQASQHWAVRQLTKVLPLDWSPDTGGAYFTRDADGRLCVTLLAASVVAVGFTDLTFAMDSISAVLSTTKLDLTPS